MEEIDYKAMGLYWNKSPKTLKAWKEDKPGKFEMMLEEFLEDQNKELNTNECEVLVTASQKGGVGKTTTSDALGFYLGDSIILNLDISQNTKDINSSPTLDYIDVMHKYSVEEIVKELSKKYRYIIIDTPGEVTSEVSEAMRLSNKIIIPMTIGKKTRVKTESTLETFFGEGSESFGEYKIFFFFNAYVNKKKRKLAAESFQKMYSKMKFNKNIKILPKLGALDYSDAIFTAEEEGKSIFTLAEENRGAYKSVLLKVNNLCSSIEAHLDI